MRGLKTLPVRMKAHGENALAISEFLENHPKTEKVIYPGFQSFPQYELARKQMKGYGGMVTFFLKGGIAESKKFLENTKLFLYCFINIYKNGYFCFVMPRRSPYTEVEKENQIREEHVKGMGDVLFKGFQCLNPKCTEFLFVRLDEIVDAFDIECPECGFRMKSGEESKFYDYKLLHKTLYLSES